MIHTIETHTTHSRVCVCESPLDSLLVHYNCFREPIYWANIIAVDASSKPHYIYYSSGEIERTTYAPGCRWTESRPFEWQGLHARKYNKNTGDQQQRKRKQKYSLICETELLSSYSLIHRSKCCIKMRQLQLQHNAATLNAKFRL